MSLSSLRSLRPLTLALPFALAGCPGPETPMDVPGNDAGMSDVPGLDAPMADTPMADTPGADVPASDTPMGTDAPVVGCTVTGYPTLDAENFASGLSSPIVVTGAPGTTDLFVAEQDGRIRVVDTSGTVVGTFLDIRTEVVAGGEQGLLGLAFHPDYATNGLFYVYYTADGTGGPSEDQVVAVGHRASDRMAEPGVTVILTIPDQAGNHNGGDLHFGPDGELYVAVGDGGPQGDPEGDAQDTTNLLGKILRIHVDAGTGDSYTVPAGNPFSGGGAEIYYYGMRNPWRFSFDRATGDMYVGDVGQNEWEEVTVAESGTAPGANFGWNECEGFAAYPGGGDCTFADLDPAVAYLHGRDPVVPSSGSAAIIGGFVYRGTAIPGLVGAYLFADPINDFVAGFRWCDGTATEYQELTDLSGLCSGISAFGEDNSGEMYMTCQGSGRVMRIIGG